MLTKIKTLLSAISSADSFKPVIAKEGLLYEGQSMCGLARVTQDIDGIRTLRFGRYGPRQSVVKIGDLDYLGLPYARSAMIGLVFSERVDRVLVMGMGAGNIPMFLHKYYSDAQVDVIDIDPQIIALAKEYFNLLEDRRLHAYAQDGREFIENVQKPYDLIFLDAYTAAGIPKHLASKEFLLSLKKALKPSGAIVANMWSTPKANPLYKSMLRTYQEVFHEVYTLRVPTAGNKILIALPKLKGVSLNNIAERAQEISAQKRLPFDLKKVLQPGLIKLIDLQESQVLLDGLQ
jgi:spermidine synthase